ncbi:MAG: cytochrome c [Planctomycetaceae bacterium]
MFRLSPIGGFQSGVVALMMCSAVITLFEPFGNGTSAAVQDEIAAPADERAMEKFMARKLAAAQRALEGVSKGDFELIRKSSAEMSDLSRHEVWERMASARFVQDTADFVTATDFLDRMAEAEDTEGVSLGFMRLTMTCANCHAHVRSSSVAIRGFDRSQTLAGR